MGEILSRLAEVPLGIAPECASRGDQTADLKCRVEDGDAARRRRMSPTGNVPSVDPGQAGR
jgi:hypothetical protein